jgi:hypothetical protein
VVASLVLSVIVLVYGGNLSMASGISPVFLGLAVAIPVAIGTGIYLSRRGWERTA